jgi:hypothetical protein
MKPKNCVRPEEKVQAMFYALAADAIGQHAKRGAVDAGHEFDGPGRAACDQRLGFCRQHRIEAPRPRRGIER